MRRTMALCAAVALFTECSGSRFTVRPLTDGGWTLVDPSGHDTFEEVEPHSEERSNSQAAH